jgi:hypothetical protein
VLQAQLDEMRSANERLLSTVQWAAGIVLTLVALFLGVNFLVNRDQLERDKRDMREDLSRRLRDDVSRRMGFLEARTGRAQRAFERRSRAEQTKSLVKMTDDMIKMSEAMLKRTKVFEHEINTAWYTLLDQDIRRMTEPDELRDAGLGVVAHSLLKAAVLIDHEPGIERALEMMIRSIENGPSTREDLVRWWEDLEALPPKFSVHVERMKALVREQRSSEDDDDGEDEGHRLPLPSPPPFHP